MKENKRTSDTLDESRSLRIRRLLDDRNWQTKQSKQRILLGVLVFILLMLAVLLAYPMVHELVALGHSS